MDKRKIEQGAKLILEGLEVDLTNHNFATTPQRYAKVMEELFSPPPTEWPVFAEEFTDMVMLRGHSFWTLCPHHMLPVHLTGTIAYKPNGHVIGASKLARIMHEANRKPETQEKLTDLIIATIKDLTKSTSQGEAIFLVGEHGCMKIRGIKSEADMVTCRFEGEFKTDDKLQERFFRLLK